MGSNTTPSAGARGEELDEVIGGHVEERVEVDAAVAVLAERPLLRRSGRGHLRLDLDIRLPPPPKKKKKKKTPPRAASGITSERADTRLGLRERRRLTIVEGVGESWSSRRGVGGASCLDEEEETAAAAVRVWGKSSRKLI